jgi:hypothetical protein
MNAWRMIVVSTALVPVVAASGCGPQQPPGPDADHGLCYQQAACSGGSLLQLPTLNECKARVGRAGQVLLKKAAQAFRSQF